MAPQLTEHDSARREQSSGQEPKADARRLVADSTLGLCLPGWAWLQRFAGDVLPSFLSLAVGLIAWESLGRILQLQYLPPLSQVILRLVELVASGRILGNLLWSLQNLTMGFGAAAFIGVAVGVAMARFRWLEKILDPYVYALLTAPTVVFVPIYFTLFGLTRWAIVGLIIQYGVFIVIVNTVTAVKDVDRELLEMAAVFGASSETKMVLKIVMPAALPFISAGLRLGMGRSVKGMINGEILIAVLGLGGMSNAFARAYDAGGVLAILLVVVVVALAANKLVEVVDDRVNAWLPSTYR